jgi:dTDP-4-amino-4,6-dideoxy-D-glucose acyltransferase
MAFLTRTQLESMGFAALGENVLISDKASIYSPGRITIGSHVRIDDFCVLSPGEGGIRLGSYIHIACFCSMIGKGAMVMEDFSGLSSRVAVYSSSDDYSGRHMSNPMVPVEFTKVDHRPVLLCKHALVGAGSIILPGVTLGEGVAVGALSLVSKSCDPFGIYMGTPAKRVMERKRTLLEHEAALRERYMNS